MKIRLILLFILTSFYSFAQDSVPASNHGSIKVQKKGTLHSVLYDDVNFRLVCLDIYGNINDTAVVSFDLDLTVKGIAYSEKTAGCFISRPMQQRLSRLDGLVILMFSNIIAKDKNGTLISFTDFKAQTGNAMEREDY
jgi:hypothetical protein